MTRIAFAALIYLQLRAARSGDGYELERLDRALDEIVSNIDRTEPVPFQCRSALANAAKVIQKRRAIRSFRSLDKPLPDGNCIDAGSIEGAYAVVEIYRWIETSPSLRASERQLLRELADGEDAASLASKYDVPVARMRERISRARASGRRAYMREVA